MYTAVYWNRQSGRPCQGAPPLSRILARIRKKEFARKSTTVFVCLTIKLLSDFSHAFQLIARVSEKKLSAFHEQARRPPAEQLPSLERKQYWRRSQIPGKRRNEPTHLPDVAQSADKAMRRARAVGHTFVLQS